MGRKMEIRDQKASKSSWKSQWTSDIECSDRGYDECAGTSE
jgi:hypothetical protein